MGATLLKAKKSSFSSTRKHFSHALKLFSVSATVPVSPLIPFSLSSLPFSPPPRHLLPFFPSLPSRFSPPSLLPPFTLCFIRFPQRLRVLEGEAACNSALGALFWRHDKLDKVPPHCHTRAVTPSLCSTVADVITFCFLRRLLISSSCSHTLLFPPIIISPSLLLTFSPPLHLSFSLPLLLSSPLLVGLLSLPCCAGFVRASRSRPSTN